ncbi:MAG: LptF/LptG family permease [Kiritimatiellae bacterium]|nr:LptF/LptG family permease [Kiritimatiellia bacterium]
MVGFCSIYVLFELFGSFSRILDAKPPLGVVVAYFAGYVAPYFMYIAPACLMLATLYTMWSFCRHSELIAMRASGIGFFAIVRPLLVAAALMACFVAWVDESYVPRKASWASAFRAARFKSEDVASAVNVVYHHAESERTWHVGKAVNADMTELVDVSVAEDYPNGVRKRTIKAPKAEFLDGQWWLHRPTILHFDPQGAEAPSPTPKHDAMELLPFPSFTESPRDFALQNRDETHYSVLDRIRFLKTHPAMTGDARRRMVYNVWSQTLAPLACLVITLFAIPAGIATGRQSVFKGILCALGMFFAFYGVSIGCMSLAYVGWFPVVPAAFLPHVAFLAVGAWMFWRQR